MKKPVRTLQASIALEALLLIMFPNIKSSDPSNIVLFSPSRPKTRGTIKLAHTLANRNRTTVNSGWMSNVFLATSDIGTILKHAHPFKKLRIEINNRLIYLDMYTSFCIDCSFCTCVVVRGVSSSSTAALNSGLLGYFRTLLSSSSEQIKLSGARLRRHDVGYLQIARFQHPSRGPT